MNGDTDGALAGFIACHGFACGRDLDHRPGPRQLAGLQPAHGRPRLLGREERLDRRAAAGLAAFKGRLLVYRRAIARSSSLAVPASRLIQAPARARRRNNQL